MISKAFILNILIAYTAPHPFWVLGPAVKRTGVGLGWFSESATELAHRDFAAQWSNYIVLDINSPKYINHRFQAVCAYNARHLWSCEITCNQLNLSKKILIKHDKVQSSKLF